MPLSVGRLFALAPFQAAYDRWRASPMVAFANGRTFDEEARWLADALDSPSPAAVLDVACGPANFTRALAVLNPEARVTALDLSAGALARGRRVARGRVAFVRGDMTRLPFADGAFERVSMCGALHMVDPFAAAAAVQEAARVLRPGGRLAGLAFSPPDGPVTRAARATVLHGLHPLPAGWLAATFEAARLRLVQREWSPWVVYFAAVRV